MPDNLSIEEYRADNASNEALMSSMMLAQHTVYKHYLTEMQNYSVIEPDEKFMNEDMMKCLRFVKLDELTFTQGEDIFQKLSTVYNSCTSLGCSVVILINVKKRTDPADFYIGVRSSEESSNDKLQPSFEALKNGLKSNFPGTKISDMPYTEKLEPLINDVFGEKCSEIASVSCVASARDKSKTENKNFIQGLERFVDTMRGHSYTALFIAEPIPTEEQALIRSGYESLYTALSSFNKTTLSYNQSESNAVMESMSHAVSESVASGTLHTQAQTKSWDVNFGINGSQSREQGSSVTTEHSKTSPTGASRVGAGLMHAAPVIGNVGRVLQVVPIPIVQGIGTVMRAAGKAAPIVGAMMQGSSTTDSIANTLSSSIARSIGLSAGANFGGSNTETNGTSETTTHGTSDTTTSGTTQTHTVGKTIQMETINKSVNEMLARIDDQLKRLRSGEDYGSYRCGAYFLSDDNGTNLLAANTYKALITGDGTSVECSAVNTWNSYDEANTSRVCEIKKYLKAFAHPQFGMLLYDQEANSYQMIPHTPATIVSGSELPLHLGLPIRSVYGLPVIEHAEFGRNVVSANNSDNKDIDIGCIYHMGNTEDARVRLSADSLTMHTFITGSTGAGKSNTIFRMLDDLCEKNVRFLVVEPAKGEYKNVFGSRKDVHVYGTNPKVMPLLRLDPFSFPSDIHVLEHLDRLVEIFNVCWPMYAAMPAVLKNAVERSYEDCGWDLSASENKFGEKMYPTFADVARNIKLIIDSSEYDNENKGAYKGSLLTRLHSLTNGINGMIFSSDELSDAELFDENVIVDLSRVGSSETKSLIMGMIVLKLQEYRMTSGGMNSSLKHVTVLEEAHNLLKRTSTEQPVEGGNLLGKSVEMIANAIAEMRTYGEGFIIADQAPALLDMAAIRNTNTKVIMRLPDQSDRELVGKAANLNDDQITELAKLPCGVAAVYQNEWIQPVLCKIDRFDSNDGDKVFSYTPDKVSAKNSLNVETSVKIADIICNGTKINPNEVYNSYMPELGKSGLDASVQVSIANMMINPVKNPKFTKLAPIMSALFPTVRDAVKSSYKEFADEKDWTASAESALRACVNVQLADNVRRDIIQAVITDYVYVELGKKADIQKWAESGGLR